MPALENKRLNQTDHGSVGNGLRFDGVKLQDDFSELKKRCNQNVHPPTI